MPETLRVLLIADTHLGFDDPAKPRVARRRRGPDFREGFERALEPADRGEVDLVVHGGDLFFRSRIPAGLVPDAFAPLFRVAARGVEVCVVPGNHERGAIPFPLLARHRSVHVFDRPRTFVFTLRGLRVAVGGFPFARDVSGRAFSALLEQSKVRNVSADVRLLALHQAVEGARVGVHDFTFRRGADVIPGRAIPRGLAAVLAGHIHRAQVLERDLHGRTLAAPVIYPGSVERTAFAERDETKGCWVLDFAPGSGGGSLVRRRFRPLPTRPMVVLEVDAAGLERVALVARLRRRLTALPPDAVVRLVMRGATLDAAEIRRLAPPTMNVELDSRAAEPRGATS